MQKLILAAGKARLVGALVASALLCGPASPGGVADAARRSKPSCQTHGRTIAANEHLRIYQAGETPDGFSARYWACRANTRKPHFLVSRDWDRDDPSIAIGGRFAAFARRTCDLAEDFHSSDPATCRGGISVYDARRNRTRFVRIGRSADDVVPYFLSVVVSANGWGAWIAVDASNYNHQVVWVLPPGRSPQLIAETQTGSVDEAYTGLALNHNRLFWRIGDRTGSRVFR